MFSGQGRGKGLAASDYRPVQRHARGGWRPFYMVNEKGLVQAIDTTAPEGAVVSTLDLQDTFIGTPSIGPKALYLRSDKFLYRLGGSLGK